MDTVYFRKKLLQWNEDSNKRPLIWRGEKDAYRVWLREIILQQTRVEQGEKYYISFLKAYPTINDFAKAGLDELYRLWQGLGYYSRCKNMWLTAQIIVEQYNGNFPVDYEKLLALKGIGKYTAAAISSFAFDLPYAVVDGNVVRVLSRFYGIQNGFHSIKDKQKYEEYATQVLDKKRNAIFNQAIMDFGAIICKPQNPLCDLCPMKKKCYAFNQNEVLSFPATKKKTILKDRYFHFIILEDEKNILLVKRKQKDIWQNLYTPILIESEEEVLSTPIQKLGRLTKIQEKFKQILSHQRIHGFFYIGRLEKVNSLQIIEYETIKVSKPEIKNFTFPQIIISFFEKYHYL